MEIVPRGYVAALEVQSTLMAKIREAQKDDKEISELKERMSKEKAKGFRKDEMFPIMQRLGSKYLKRLMTHHTRFALETTRCVWI